MTQVDARAVCPKHMRYGPCGGARRDGSCELGDRPCPYVPVDWHDPSLDAPRATSVPATFRPAPVLIDVRAPAGLSDDRAYWQAIADALGGSAALLGEHADNVGSTDDAGRPSTDVVISWLADRGVQVWVTLTGRNRSADGAAATMRRHRDAGAAVIHCVTGDHPRTVGNPEETAFQTESFVLARTAADLGLVASVAESPASPGDRPGRVARKQAAGASVCVLNHAGSVADLAGFAAAVEDAGASLPMVAPVPMVADAATAVALANLPGLDLQPGLLDAIANSPDPPGTARQVAVELIGELRATGRFAGCNLSGGSRLETPSERVALTATFAEAATAAWGSS